MEYADPFAILPLEIIREILLYFDLKTRMKIVAVSKRWRNLASALPELWRDMDFSIAIGHRIQPRHAKALIQRSQHTTSRAVLTNMSTRTAWTIMEDLNGCSSSLESLRMDVNVDSFRQEPLNFHNFENLRCLTTSDQFGMKFSDLRKLLEHCRYIEEIDVCIGIERKTVDLSTLPRAPHLKFFSLASRPYYDPDLILPCVDYNCKEGKTLADIFPSLEEFYLSDILLSAHPRLEGLSCLRRFGLLNIKANMFHGDDLILPSTLEYLSLSHSVPFYTMAVQQLPNLKSLVLNRADCIFESVWNEWTANMNEQLTNIDIEEVFEPKVVAYLIRTALEGRLRSVENLNMGGLFVNDDVIATIVPEMPNLKTINISETRVTSQGIECLVNAGLPLEKVTARCLRHGQEGIAYARAAGVEVDTFTSTRLQKRK